MKWQTIEKYAFRPSKVPDNSILCLALILKNEKVDELTKLLGTGKAEIIVQRQSEKRTLNANSYMWTICDELGKKLMASKEDIYRNAIRQVGVYDTLAVTPLAYEAFTRKWEGRGVGWIVEIETKAKTYYQIRVYYGSSTYDKAQMARLIDWLVQEAETQGLDVMPKAERDKIIKDWKCGYYDG